MENIYSYPKPARVAISDAHNGQICYPTVRAEYTSARRVHVWAAWIDQSVPHGDPKREYGQAEYRGSVRDAEEWLIRGGIRLDAQGIY